MIIGIVPDASQLPMSAPTTTTISIAGMPFMMLCSIPACISRHPRPSHRASPPVNAVAITSMTSTLIL